MCAASVHHGHGQGQHRNLASANRGGDFSLRKPLLGAVARAPPLSPRHGGRDNTGEHIIIAYKIRILHGYIVCKNRGRLTSPAEAGDGDTQSGQRARIREREQDMGEGRPRPLSKCSNEDEEAGKIRMANQIQEMATSYATDQTQMKSRSGQVRVTSILTAGSEGGEITRTEGKV